MQLNVMCNLSYATTHICSCMCCMQLNFSCKQQLQNPKFLVVEGEDNGVLVTPGAIKLFFAYEKQIEALR